MVDGTQDEPRIRSLPDADFQRVLCVVAHPDDMEYGASTAVATWTRRGVEVAYLLITRGEAGMDGSPPERTREIRTADQQAACAAVGVSRLDFLDRPDGVLTGDLDLRRDIARAIRQFRPDAVVGQTWAIEAPWGLNQADHRVAGLATLDAVRDADNRWVFRELLDEGLEPWPVRWLLVSGDPAEDVGVEIDQEALDRGIASLEAHAGYLAALPWHPAPREMLTEIAEAGGRALGTRYAALFRGVELHPVADLADGD